MGVPESWKRIETWLKANASPIRKSLRPEAKAGALEELLGKLGLSLPADFIESVRLHDGQKPEAEHGLFPVTDDVLGPLPACRLLPIAEIAREWEQMKQLQEAGNFAGKTTEPAPGVRGDWWNPGWVPIADNGGGDYFCIDLVPDKGGTAGQVIVFYHDMTDRPRLAPSHAKWLEELADGLESGRYVFGEDEGIVEAMDEDDDA
jgi:cell wall assembly regulator SMI1